MLHYLDWFGFILYQCLTQYLLFIITFLQIDLIAHHGAGLHCRAAPLRIVRTGLHWFLPSTDFPLLILTNQSLPQSHSTVISASPPLHQVAFFHMRGGETGGWEPDVPLLSLPFGSLRWQFSAGLLLQCHSMFWNWKLMLWATPHSQCSCCYGNRSTRAHLSPALQTLAPGNLRHFGPGSV